MLVNKIDLTEKFKKSFRKLPASVQKQAVFKIEIFKIEPLGKSLKTHKLKGKLKNKWSFSVDYSHRIVFEFASKSEVVFYDIGDHDVYR